MSESFQVGEIAILFPPRGAKGTAGCPEVPRGTEVEIIAPLSWYAANWPAGMSPQPIYKISANGTIYGAPPTWLKKRKPPPKREDIGEWDLCPWQPAKRVTLSEE